MLTLVDSRNSNSLFNRTKDFTIYEENIGGSSGLVHDVCFNAILDVWSLSNVANKYR